MLNTKEHVTMMKMIITSNKEKKILQINVWSKGLDMREGTCSTTRIHLLL